MKKRIEPFGFIIAYGFGWLPLLACRLGSLPPCASLSYSRWNVKHPSKSPEEEVEEEPLETEEERRGGTRIHTHSIFACYPLPLSPDSFTWYELLFPLLGRRSFIWRGAWTTKRRRRQRKE